MKKICIVSTTGSVVNAFMLKHIELLKESYDITVVLGDDVSINTDVRIKRIDIKRKISLLDDIKSIFELKSFFKNEEFDIVFSIMPKSGLLSMLASNYLKIGTRIHFFTGQVWATKSGLFRLLLKFMDILIVRNSTNILVDSFSQRDFLKEEKVLTKYKGDVLSSGSISGVNMERFKENLILKEQLKDKYNIPKDNIVFMFVGRITKDKGIKELSELFLKLFSTYSNISLVLMGPLEDKELEVEISDFLTNKNVVYNFKYIDNPEVELNLADVLVLPSHREGFGTVVIEAASMKIPTIGSNIYGLTDSILDNKTGLLHKVSNIDDMYEKYTFLIENQQKIKDLGENAYDRILNEFKDTQLSNHLLKYIIEAENE